MKFAPVLPVSLYDKLDHGDYHLLQAHMMMGHDGVLEWARLRGQDNFRHTVTLDNGAVELGEPDLNSLVRVSEIVAPDRIICPDVVRDPKATFRNCAEHSARLARLCNQLVLVPQGKNMHEWMTSFDALWEYSSALKPVIAISKFIAPYANRTGLYTALSWIQDKFRTTQSERPIIHLLGTFEGFDDLVTLDKLFNWVDGCDTTWPFAMAYNGLWAVRGLTTPCPMNDDYWDAERLGRRLLQIASANIATCRQEIGDYQ